MKQLTKTGEDWSEIARNPRLRRALAQESLWHFVHLYMPEHVKIPFGAFQKELIRLIANPEVRQCAITAFRGSGKSTLTSLSLPLWATVTNRAKFIVIITKTQAQARMHMNNIRREIETNSRLRHEWGLRFDEGDEWHQQAIVLEPFGVKIMVASIGESIRGQRFGNRRPGLIILDDIEDLDSVRTKEGRDYLYNTVTSEIIPMGDVETRVIMVGNLLHRDSVMMRFKERAQKRGSPVTYREYPLLDAKGKCLWPQKFPDKSAIGRLQAAVGNDLAWRREYLLEIVNEDGQVIPQEWIHYYAKLPDEEPAYRALGVDLAIAQSSRSDKTAIVVGRVYGYGDKRRIYIEPYPVNRHLTMQATLETIKELAGEGVYGRATTVVETNAYQVVVADYLEADGYPVERTPSLQEKRSRLLSVSHLMSKGTLLFSEHGAEELISQILGFGTERHDDLMDALVILLLHIINWGKEHQFPVFPIPLITMSAHRRLPGEDDEHGDHYQSYTGRWSWGP